MYKHKYLAELEAKYPDLGQLYPFHEPDDKHLTAGLEEYGFDVRETFNLWVVLAMWLYERLRYFLEVGGSVINLTYHKFEIDGEKLTLQECVERMIKDCEIMIVKNEWITEDVEEMNVAREDLFKVLNKVYWALWW